MLVKEDPFIKDTSAEGPGGFFLFLIFLFSYFYSSEGPTLSSATFIFPKMTRAVLYLQLSRVFFALEGGWKDKWQSGVEK